MKIEDKRNDNKRKCAGIGDMVITDRNVGYLILGSSINQKYPIAVYDLNKNCISMLHIGEDLIEDETIMEIIPKEKLKLVIE